LSEHAEFWSQVARQYDRVVDRQLGGTTRSMARERLAKEPRLGTVAELGCGTGFFTERLAERAGRVVATDVAPGMLALARERVRAPNVVFQVEDCQHTSFPDAAFDAAVVSLVLHFTEPARTLAEMHRILKPRGTLVLVNLDMRALTGLARVRFMARVLYEGIVGYRLKPPKNFGGNALSEAALREALAHAGFDVAGSETILDPSRASNVPLDYVTAIRR